VGTKRILLPAKKIPQFKAWQQFDHGLPVDTAQGSSLSLPNAVVPGSLENNAKRECQVLFACVAGHLKLSCGN
jgi:hypothetical protein